MTASPAASGPPATAAVPAGRSDAVASASGVRLMGRGTLSRQLVLRVTALVALVAIALSGLTVVAVQTILQSQQDVSLREIGARAPRDKAEPGASGGGGGRQDGLLQFRDYGSTLAASVQTQGTLSAITLDAAQQLQQLSPGTITTLNLDGLGLYRVYAFTDPLGYQGAVGLPSSQISRPVLTLLGAASGFTALAIGLSFVVARQVVQRSLAPLQRLATTAQAVSRLELHSGEVDVPVRVPASDTDPRSEVGQVGIAFNRMLDNVEGALEARQRSETKVRQFVADASHELRNPLASIRGYAELTRRERDEAPPTTAHALGRIESESARMSSLVEDLLLLARLDAGPNLALAPTRVNEIVANAVSDAQVAGPDHEWELTLPEEDVVAVADPYRLLQVVANLLANARTHTPAGTLVRTSLASEGGFAVITVADTGPGIPGAIRDKVFERFTRADASRVRSGQGQSTGLGLAIVAAVMQAHGGSASVESTAAGTSFTVRVPLARAA